MKGFLVDENLPVGLNLRTKHPTSHVTAISDSPSDSSVWDYARIHHLAIVTKDADFSHRILASEPPPWIIHVRVGKMRLEPFIAHLPSIS